MPQTIPGINILGWGILWIEGGIVGEMLETEKKQYIARLKRLAGQAKALEVSYLSQSTEGFITQLEAVIAASRSAMATYAQLELVCSKEDSRKRLLIRLIKKG